MRIKKVESSYSQQQLQDYLERVKWTGSAPRPTLEDLQKLTRHHLASIPFCNTFLVYEEDVPTVDPQDVFKRTVTDRGGCFCFGQNLLFREVLRAVGFRCYSGAARVNGQLDSTKPPEPGNLSHMTIFVTFEDSVDESNDENLYLVDVGFGRACIPQPMQLRSRKAVNGFLNDWHRITIRRHPKTSFVEEEEIVDAVTAPTDYQYAIEWRSLKSDGSVDKDWAVQYMFSTAEMYAQDYEALHFYVSRCAGLFTKNLILSRLVPSPPNALGEMGVLTLMNNVFKRRMPGQAEERIEFETEQQRIDTIRKEFDVGNIPSNGYDIAKSKGLALS